MSISDLAQSGLVARAKAVLMQPTAVWDVIDTEPATVAGLYRGYVIPLAAIPAVCGFVGHLVFGLGAFSLGFRISPIWFAMNAILSYAMSLAMVYIMALVIEGLAPTFGAQKDRTQALKLAAYAPTASWVAGVFSLIPMLAIISLLGGLYTLYTLYRGLPKMMKAPADKALPYFGVVLVVMIVIALVIGGISGAVMTLGMGGGMLAGGRIG